MTLPLARRRSVLATALAALALGGAACDDDGRSTPAADTVSAGGCHVDPRVDAWALGAASLTKAGESGLLTFEVVAADPTDPVKGQNTWTVKVLDSAGAAVTGATVTARPWMPDHGHGTSATPVVTEAGGAYAIAPLYLFMRGVWEVTIEATLGEDVDRATFTCCID